MGNLDEIDAGIKNIGGKNYESGKSS